MTKAEILNKVDHTLLTVTATKEGIKQLCDEAIQYAVASVCVPPSFVKFASEYVKGAMKICTVIGFPNGYNTTDIKVAEALDSIKNGADEIDMVVNIGDVKMANWTNVENEIQALRKATEGRILKVIIEACLLTTEEKIMLCKIVSSAKADFIKTSTGFSLGGATLDDVRLFKQHIDKNVKIKAAGGIRSFEDGENFVLAGADRLGTSALIKCMKENG